MLIAFFSIGVIANYVIAYAMYLSRFKVRVKHARIYGLRLMHLASGLHFVATILFTLAFVSLILFLSDIGPEVEGEIWDMIEKVSILFLSLGFIGMLLVWVVIELVMSMFFNKPFAGGGMK